VRKGIYFLILFFTVLLNLNIIKAKALELKDKVNNRKEKNDHFIDKISDNFNIGDPDSLKIDPNILLDEEVQNKEENLLEDIKEEEEKPRIPIVINDKVEYFIRYFKSKKKRFFSESLSRSGRYIPLIKEIFRKENLPPELAYLALIESGFKINAYSKARAYGLWQFMKGTGRKYGLRIDFWVDERRDPEKSTIAAARYLKDLYNMFNSWELAIAAYNAGELRIQRAIKRYKTRDFWKLSKKRYIPLETKNFVPKFFAAVLIAENPEKYGFYDIGYKKPVIYDRVKVSPKTNLRLIAKACGSSIRYIRKLNPALKRGYTPPYSNYEVKIPSGKEEAFMKNFIEIRSLRAKNFIYHLVKRGDTLSKIARLYNTSMTAILEANNLHSFHKIRRGSKLVIPVGEKIFSKVMVAKSYQRKAKFFIYTVKRGDTIWDISKRFRVSMHSIYRWNRLRKGYILRPGRRLKIYANNGYKRFRVKRIKEIIYRIKKGDTLWDIAEKYDLNLSDIKSWNNIKGNRIYAGGKLRLKVSID